MALLCAGLNTGSHLGAGFEPAYRRHVVQRPLDVRYPTPLGHPLNEGDVRPSVLPQQQGRTNMKRYLMASCLALAGCGANTGARPAVEVKVVERVVETQRPCSATAPVRPAPLAKPLPTDAIALSALLGAKLQEYAGDGAFADKALASLAICTKPTP